MFDSFFFCKVPFSSGIQGRNRQIQNFYTKNFSDFPSKILDIIFLRCDNKAVERFQTSHNFINGLVAQLGAHHIRIVGVVGSNPIRSTEKTPFPLRDGVFYMERVPPVVFNILAFICVNLHLRANAHLRHVIFLITRKFRYNLPLIPKTAARYFPQQRHSIHSVLNLRARITVQNNCSHRQQVHPPVFLTSHHHEQISHPQAQYQYSES